MANKKQDIEIERKFFKTVSSHLKSKQVNGWDGRTDAFEHNRLLQLIISKISDNYIDVPLKILEAGGGEGIYGKKILEFSKIKVEYMINGDISFDMLRIALENRPENYFVCNLNLLEFLPFKDEVFDYVLLLGALHHFPSTQEVQEIFKEASRVVRKGIICYEPCGDNRISLFFRMIGRFFGKLLLVTPYALSSPNETLHKTEEYVKCLSDTGFSGIETIGIDDPRIASHEAFVAWKRNLRFSPLFMQYIDFVRYILQYLNSKLFTGLSGKNTLFIFALKPGQPKP